MSVRAPWGWDTTLSPPLCLHHPKEYFLNALEPTAAHINSSPQPPTIFYFFFFCLLSPLFSSLSYPPLPSRLLLLLFSRHFTHFSPFLLGLCCPQGVWDGLGDSLYVLLSWPELPSWGSFDGVGDYSPCSLGRTPLSHSSSSSSSMHIQTYTYRHTLEK